MSTLLYALGRWSYRHSWRVLIAWLLLLGIAGVGAVDARAGHGQLLLDPGHRVPGGHRAAEPHVPAGERHERADDHRHGRRRSVEDEPYASAIADTIAELEDLDGILAVTDPFSEIVNGQVSEDGDAAIVRMQFDGQATDVPPGTKTALQDVAAELREELPAGSEVALGGDLFALSVPGVTITEAVGLLIALLVLIVTFRSFVVAGLPLLTAIIGVGLSIALIFLSTAFASISSTTPLLALMLGLAVGIDYALFIVARHQDQVRAGVDPEESAARATGTAGSAVVFAGVTVLIALIGLSFAGIPFLTTMGIAAAVAVAIAVLVALTLTPAMLGFLKGRVAGRPKRASSRRSGSLAQPTGGRGAARTVSEQSRSPSERSDDAGPQRPKRGFATRWVGLVTKHPIVTTVAVVLDARHHGDPRREPGARPAQRRACCPRRTRRVRATTSSPRSSAPDSTARSS